jgi:hypothetical protein
MHGPLEITKQSPLRLRYLLQAHRGPLDVAKTNQTADRFAEKPGLIVRRSKARHTEFEIIRTADAP